MIPSSRLAGLCLGTALLPVALTAQTVTVNVTSESGRDRLAEPLQLGLNLEWDGVQHYPVNASNLWDGTNPTPKIVEYLKTDFAGAIYRYPGGMGANFEWQKSVGPTRPLQYNSTAKQNQPVLFGFDEAMKFVEAVGGRMLPVVNIYRMDGAVITDGQWAELKKRQLGWLEYANAPAAQVPANDWNGDGVYQGKMRSDYGHPAPYNITMWELGNEMDHGGTMDYETFIERCSSLMADMLSKQSNLKILVAGRTAPWGPGLLADPQPPLSPGATTASWRDWHNAFLPAFGQNIWAIATHPYYDGNSIPYTQTFINTTANDAKNWATLAGLPPTAAPKVAITENAVLPDGVFSTPANESLWPRSTALRWTTNGSSRCGGAVAVVDFAILQHYYKPTQMLITHELACKGPWPLFNNVGANGYIVDASVFAPRPLAHSLQLLNRVAASADVLTATATVTNASGYGYDVRALGYKNGASGIQGALLVNRANVGYPLNLKLPGWASGSQVVRIEAIGGQDETKLWRQYVSADVSNSQATLKLPALSVFNAVALGANIALNGDFETGTAGSVPTGWSRRVDAGGGTSNLVADSAGSVNGAKVVRLVSNSAVPVTQLVQSGGDIGSGGAMSTNLNASYVLRANVRTSGTVANKVGVRMQIFPTTGTVAIPQSPYASAASGVWEPLQIEFVPSNLIGTSALNYAEIVLQNASSTGFAEFDGVTLFRRENTAKNPNLLDTADVSGVPDDWSPRNDGTGTIVYNGTGTPKYVRLSKTTAASTNQFYQDVVAGSKLADRLNEKWRLRARVRYSGLDGAGAQLKVQFFGKLQPGGPATYMTSSPMGPAFGTNGATSAGWVETVLEFEPRAVLGAAAFDKAEIMLQNNSHTGYVEVSFMSLEAVD